MARSYRDRTEAPILNKSQNYVSTSPRALRKDLCLRQRKLRKILGRRVKMNNQKMHAGEQKPGSNKPADIALETRFELKDHRDQ